MQIDKGKKILEKYPYLKNFLKYIYNSVSFNRKRIRGKNNQINTNLTFMKKCIIIINGNNNKITFGNMNYLINTKIQINGDNNEIILGDRVYINNGDLYLEDSFNKLKIGNHTTISGNTHLALTEGKNIIIGNNCLFSSNVVFRTGDSHSIIDNSNKRINFAKDIVIEDHVWFAQNTTILKGVCIKANSVVASGSVVTKNFQVGNVIIGGNPAKVIKENINWKQERN